MAMLASTALCDLILPALLKARNEFNGDTYPKLFRSTQEKILFAFILICLIFGMQVFSIELSAKHVTPGTLLAFDWVKSHTEEDSSFLILTGENAPLEDFTNEWFPVLTNRTSITTVQGLEWNKNVNFNKRLSTLKNIQTCRLSQNIIQCIETIQEKSNIDFQYLFILRKSYNPLIQYLKEPFWEGEKRYEIIYESDDILIVNNP